MTPAGASSETGGGLGVRRPAEAAVADICVVFFMISTHRSVVWPPEV